MMAKRKIEGDRAYQPTPRECAMLLLKLIEAKHQETGKEVTRTKLSEATLRQLWCRGRSRQTSFTKCRSGCLWRAGSCSSPVRPTR